MGGISSKEAIIERLDTLDREEININKQLRELQIELGIDKICNKIYFYEKGTSKGKRELLEFYNILVVDTDVAPHKEDYSPIYEDLIDKMINNFK